jgi:hypothetical protein
MTFAAVFQESSRLNTIHALNNAPLNRLGAITSNKMSSCVVQGRWLPSFHKRWGLEGRKRRPGPFELVISSPTVIRDII